MGALALGWIWLLMVVIFVSTTEAFLPYLAPATISWPTNPGAHCVNKSDLQPSDLPDPTCLDYITYDMIYMDELTPYRVQMAKYVPIELIYLFIYFP